jgi:hypothetical protein
MIKPFYWQVLSRRIVTYLRSHLDSPRDRMESPAMIMASDRASREHDSERQTSQSVHALSEPASAPPPDNLSGVPKTTRRTA